MLCVAGGGGGSDEKGNHQQVQQAGLHHRQLRIHSAEKAQQKKSPAAHVCSVLAPADAQLIWVQHVWGRSDVAKRWRRGRRCDVAAMKRQRLILKRAAGLGAVRSPAHGPSV